MSSVLCPNGHASDEPDYCSVCGAPMDGAAPSTPAHAGAGDCPECGTPRADAAARYCEVCRYDFEARQPGPAPVAEAKPAVAAPAAPAPPAGSAGLWRVVVTVDPSLDVEPDPDQPPPTDVGERMFPVDLPEMLIGRRDEKRGIRPEIPVLDPAVSRRHAQLLVQPNGELAILDLASANGTAVNGKEIAAGDRVTLADGDVITMGRWTRIELHAAKT